MVAANLGRLYDDVGESDRALEHYDRALSLDPECFPARLNRGVHLLWRKRHAEALAEFDRLAASHPLSAVHVNRARALFGLFLDAEAGEAARKAIELDPKDQSAWYNLALAASAAGRLDEAQQAFGRARAADPKAFARMAGDASYGSWNDMPPHPASIFISRAIERQRLCDWSVRADLVAQLRSTVGLSSAAELAKHHYEYAFDLLALPLSATEQLACASHIARAYDAAPKPAAASRTATGPRIRVGFLSPDYRAHPMAWLSRTLFERLDRLRFEVHAYALNPDQGDPLRARMLKLADRFLDVSEWNDDEIAARVATDGIDILIECGGYCMGTRPGILARHAAPVNASYLGMPGTLGTRHVDYRISDAWCTPAATQPLWTERLLLLPETHLVYDPPEVPARAVPDRAALGLPEGAMVFCSLNNPMKIGPDAFAVWMRILRETPGSVLWINATEELARGNLRAAAARAGTDAARLRFGPRLEHDVFVAAVGNADLFLDTFSFSAHTTAMDVLWGGLPLLALPGEAMASRLSASLLQAARLPELVAASVDDYVEKAVRLAKAPDELRELRQRLQAARTASPLFDADARVRAFERGLEAMAARSRAGLPPATLLVE